jgi:AcrR family transcriptional regulator
VTSVSSRGPGRARATTRGDATREAILVAAERLFAERGFAAVSLREICTAAGQRNSVAVQYHFGDRENLIREIAGFRSRDLIEAGADLLAELLADEKSLTLADCVAAQVRSLARNLAGDNFYLPFLARYIIERGDILDLEASLPPSTVITWARVIRRLLPDYSETLITERWDSLMVGVVHSLARYHDGLRRSVLGTPVDELVDDLIRYHAAGLGSDPGSPV